MNGIWVTKLVEKLQESVPLSSPFQHIEVETRALEDWLAEGWLVSDKVEDDVEVVGIVNRVSDAASPSLFKACCAVLAAAEQTLNIPVWNGSTAYSLCGNKWRHHLLFRQAKLSSPKTMVYYSKQYDERLDSSGGENFPDQQHTHEEKHINVDKQIFQKNLSGRVDILVKPNAGGFGAGIRKISLPSSTAQGTTRISIPSSFEDDMVLVQQYEVPRDGKIYRVWFLNGKVQCAVARIVNNEAVTEEENGNDNENIVSSSTEFTSGCAGGTTCTFSGFIHQKNSITRSTGENMTQPSNYLSKPSSSSKTSNILQPTVTPSNMIPWKVPAEVRREIEDRLLPLLVDAHCGSVEFLYASTPSKSSPGHSIDDSRHPRDSTEKLNQQLASEFAEQHHNAQDRLYFDLNLLSTLPVVDSVDTAQDRGQTGEGGWPLDFDPWLDLALGVWEFCMTGKKN